MTTRVMEQSSLEGLIERVKASTGPSEKLDYAIDEWLYASGGMHHGELEVLPRFTASIDAALGLAERVLPGWQFRILDLSMMAIRSEFNRMTDNLNVLHILPKHIVLATLIAIQSSETSNADRP